MLIFFSYNPYAPPYLEGGVVGPEGRVTHTARLDCPLPSLFHDIAITENHTIFLDLPMIWDPEERVMSPEVPATSLPGL